MRVLIADDNIDLTQTLIFLLEEWKFESICVHDGRTALSLLRESESPTLAILDWYMPGMNGIDICRELRKDVLRPYQYVILMSGRGGKAHMLDGLNAGADDYLIKPVDPNELHARLSTGSRILRLQDQLLATQRQIKEQAARDFLTGLWNRGMILEILERELTRGRRDGTPVTVLMGDIDHFKSINDTHGHLAGDQVLRQTAQRLLGALRPYDTIGRYGGEEFLGVFANCDARDALVVGERLRCCMEAEPIFADGVSVPVTMSLGTATSDQKLSTNELLRLADSAMYRAKKGGRNRVVCSQALDILAMKNP